MGQTEEEFDGMKEEYWNVGKMDDQRQSTGCFKFAGFQDLTQLKAGQVGMEKETLHGVAYGVLLRKMGFLFKKKSANHLLASEGFLQFSILNFKIKLEKQNITEFTSLVTLGDQE